MARPPYRILAITLCLAAQLLGCTQIVQPDPSRLSVPGEDRDSGLTFDEDAGPGRRDAGTVEFIDAGPHDAGTVVVISDEICNGLDDDQQGGVDDGLDAPGCPLSAGVCAGSVEVCGGTAGWLDCNAASYGPRFQASETSCDGFDNDCDGTEDEGCLCSVDESRDCGSDIGECELGTQHCVGGTFGDCEGDVGSVPETCDGRDNDCSGTADDGLVRPACANTLGVCAGSRAVCGGVDGWRTCGAAEYGPSYQATETACDGLNNDCDGSTDEGCPTGCSYPGSSCSASQVCACPGLAASCVSGGTCVDVFGPYAIRITNVSFPSRDPAGECWDVDCSAPDPFVEVSKNGAIIATTSTRNNTLTANWNTSPITTTLANGDSVRFDVWDEDFAIHDFGMACTTTATATMLQNRTITCSIASGLTITAAFIPSP